MGQIVCSSAALLLSLPFVKHKQNSAKLYFTDYMLHLILSSVFLFPCSLRVKCKLKDRNVDSDI